MPNSLESHKVLNSLLCFLKTLPYVLFCLDNIDPPYISYRAQEGMASPFVSLLANKSIPSVLE